MASLSTDVFNAHATITAGVLRNGPANAVVRTARASALDPRFHFRGVRYDVDHAGNAAALAPPVPTVVVLEAQIRTAFATNVVARVQEAADAAAAAAAAPGAAGGAAFDRGAALAATAALPVVRTESIASGCAHAALVTSYHIAEADLRATEVGTEVLALVPPPAAADAAAYTAALATKTSGWEVVVASGSAAGALTEDETLAINFPTLNTTESELAFALFAMGQAAPVRAGVQLLKDGHHYLTASNQRHRAIEREITGKIGADARALWNGSTAEIRNALWHAGIHFVRADILEDMATDPVMPDRLNRTGYGSMSVGLPAHEELFNRAGSYIAVYNAIRTTATSHGHRLEIDRLASTVTVIKALPRTGTITGPRPAFGKWPAGTWTAPVNTRAAAVKACLVTMLDEAEPVAAWMFGYYREISANQVVAGGRVENSLLNSYSLIRAANNHLGEANRAVEMYTAYRRYARARAEEGELETYSGSA